MADEQVAPVKRGIDLKYIIIGVIFVALTIAVSFGVAFIVSSKNTAPKTTAKEEKKVAEELGPTVDIADPFTVNITGTSSKYLQVKLAFIVSDEKVKEEADNKILLLQHTTLLVLRSKSLEALTDIQAQEKLGEELKASLNKFLQKGKIEKVLMTKYIIQ